MENRSHALIAGLFLLILGASAVAALWWFSGRSEASNSYVVETRRNVTGLSLQAQVRYRGIRVGRVESIALDPADARKTLVGITVRNDIPVTRGTIAKLGYQGVTGIAHILLEDDGKDATPLPVDAPEPARIAMKDSLVEELADVGGDALRQARELLSGMNDLLRPENRRTISQTLTNLEESSRRAVETTERLQQMLNPENMRRMNATLVQAEQTVAQAAPFFAEARGLVARLQSASDRFEAALGDPNAGGMGSVAPRLNELTTELGATAQQLNRVLRMLEESPQSLIFGRQNPPPGPGEAGFVAPPTSRGKP